MKVYIVLKGDYPELEVIEAVYISRDNAVEYIKLNYPNHKEINGEWLLFTTVNGVYCRSTEYVRLEECDVQDSDLNKY